MPHPISDIHIKIDPFALSKRPELASHIGIITSAWSEIEDELAMLYAMALRTNPAWAARSLGCTSNLLTRLTMIETALGLSFSSSAKAEFSKNFVPKIRKRYGERNKVVHCVWAVHDRFPECLIRFAGLMANASSAFERYDLKDFQHIELRLLALHVDLRKFGQSLARGEVPEGPTEETWRVVPIEKSKLP